MNRDEFYKIGLAAGWLDKGEMCGGVSASDRAVAVHAIAARASGTPAQAAIQILAGIAALDAGTEFPVVVLWPEGFDDQDYLIKRAEWHADQASLLTEWHRRIQLFMSSLPSQASESASCPSNPNAQYRSEQPGMHDSSAQAREVRHAEPAEAAHASEKTPDQGANDASE
jgi:hypothetical protein